MPPRDARFGAAVGVGAAGVALVGAVFGTTFGAAGVALVVEATGAGTVAAVGSGFRASFSRTAPNAPPTSRAPTTAAEATEFPRDLRECFPVIRRTVATAAHRVSK